MARKQREFDFRPVVQPNYRNLLIHIRRELGYGSMQAMSDHFGVSQSSLAEVSAGKTKTPRSVIGWGLQSTAIDLFGMDKAREIWEKNTG